VPTLFDPVRIGDLDLPNRIVMAPLTRTRCTNAQAVPNDLMLTYYRQRASAGMIITEGVPVTPMGVGYAHVPGIWSDEQVAGWRRITEAVHAAGGRILMQLWHVGRISDPMFLSGELPVAPSAIAATGTVSLVRPKTPFTTPRPLRLDELPAIVEAFRRGAENAQRAGFDGVELHGANGYLLDEFLRDGANKRTGPYGGSIENRARLMLEVVKAVSTVWSGDRVGLRISPLNSYNSMIDSDPIALTSYLATKLNDYGLAYLHMMRADFFQAQQGDVMTSARAAYKGVLIGNMGYTAAEAESAIAAGQLDAVAFGTSFLANPDLPARIAAGAELTTPNPGTFYSPGPEGYTDYPFLAA
jgi:N-ethylmaleimide reductase